MKINKNQPNRLQWDAWLSLVRLPNSLTVLGDPIMGFFMCGGGLSTALIIPVVITILIYVYGLILNDVVDFKIDAQERPERPLPSGRINKNVAIYVSYIFPVVILILALVQSPWVFLASIAVLGLTLLYNLKYKKYKRLGPLVMAFCRVGSLIIGMTAVETIRFDIHFAFFTVAILGQIFYVYGLSRLARDEMLSQPNRFGRISILIGASFPLAVFCFIVSGPQFVLTAEMAILLSLSLYLLLSGFKTFLILAAPFRTTKDVQKQVTHLIGNFTLFQACWISVSSAEHAAYVALIIGALFFPYYFLTKFWKAT